MIVNVLKSNPVPLNILGKSTENLIHPKDFQMDMDGKRLKFAMMTPDDQFVSEVFVIMLGKDQCIFTLTRKEKFLWT